MRIVTLLFPLLLAAMPAACAGDDPGSPTPADLDWLSGYWVGEQGGMRIEELWLAPSGGLMLGLHRDLPSSGRAFFEYLRIEQDEDGVVYLASPGGRPATPFRLVEAGRARAVFANPEHDFPQRIIYELHQDGGLEARIEGIEDGRERSARWLYRAADFPSPTGR